MNDKTKDALDAARRALLPLGSRSSAMSFTAFAYAPVMTRRDGSDETWNVTEGSRAARFDAKRSSEAGTLAVLTDFVWYGSNGGLGGRCGALTTIPVRLSQDARTATAIGPAVENRTLIDLLARNGALLHRTGQGYGVEQGGEDHVRFEPGSRLSALTALAITADRYLDHEIHPEVTNNDLVTAFVAERFQSPPPSALDGEKSVRQRQAGSPIAVTLDPDQREALNLALTSTALIIDGPPGSGKSQVITAIAHEIIARGKRAIITSTESSALDVARRRLSDIDDLPAHILIGSPDEILAKAPPVIGVPDFDLLIVDECSRMSFELGLALLTRARAVVIIGDDRQLRPDRPGETILDRASKMGIPRTTLRFHYRSQDRSLITISNILAYDMKLRTAPTPWIRPTDGVVVVDLEEGRTTSTTGGVVNIEEARTIVEKVAALRASGDQSSIGIVTANQSQSTLIERLMASSKLGKPSVEPLFVRPCHRVQGEERDIVLVSTVYDGRDPSDRFGMFDQAGSVERLNVMLSRSRSEMWIFTSFCRTTPRPKSPPSRGRIAYEAMRTLLDVMTEAETRLSIPDGLRDSAPSLGMRLDNLGIVYGFRRRGAERYAVGLVVIDETKTPDHWEAIIIQLTSLGWKIVQTTADELKVRPKGVTAMVSKAVTDLQSPPSPTP